MKKILVIILAIYLITSISCAHKRYAEKSTSLKVVVQPYFLFISDIHLDVTLQHTDSTTDTGMDLWNNFKVKVDSILASETPPAFVICTGDLPAHYKCDTTCYLSGKKLQRHNDELDTVLTDLRNLVTKYHVPLYYVPGNNDGIAGDYYSFTNERGQTAFSLVPDVQNPYPALNTSATGSVAPHLISMPHPGMGYYSALAVPGLRVIAFNSVIFDNKYQALDGVQQIDAGNEEMNWLSAQLKEAKSNGEKVYIAMHIPPGVDAFKFTHHKIPNTSWASLPSAENNWLKTFLSLASNYRLDIAGIFYGHTHMDELRLLYDSTGTNVTEVAISSPGLTPQHGNNPGFKTVNYDPVTMQPTDFTTYYTTFPVTSTWGNEHYSFSDIYNSKPTNSIYNFLSSQKPDDINKSMNKIYTVMHGAPVYNTTSGMLVKWDN